MMRFPPMILVLGLISSVIPGCVQTSTQGASGGATTLDELTEIEGVDRGQADWLREHLTPDEAGRLFALIRELSPTEAARRVTTYFQEDPSYGYLMAWPELRDSVDLHLRQMSEPAPEGAEGLVRVAFHLSRIRAAILDRYSELPYYRLSFMGEPLQLPTAPPLPSHFDLELDFSPARTQLDIIGDTHRTPDSIRASVQGEVFDALLQHRGQDFYPLELTREHLVTSLARAAGDSPLEQLYRYAFPVGLLHFADVRERLSKYRHLVGTLEARETDIAEYVASRILPYVPADLTFTRTVHFLFADGADGWASDGVAAVDLEYFKDDSERLLTLLTHETFHAIQSAARRPTRDSTADRRQELFAEVLESVFNEGTATYVAPPQQKSAAEQARLAAEGADLLEELHQALSAEPMDEEKVQELRGRGIQGAGPFYWLGSEMSAVIVDVFGPGAIATALEHGGVRFFELYMDAAEASRREEIPRFSEELMRSVRAM